MFEQERKIEVRRQQTKEKRLAQEVKGIKPNTWVWGKNVKKYLALVMLKSYIPILYIGNLACQGFKKIHSCLLAKNMSTKDTLCSVQNLSLMTNFNNETQE